MLCFLVVFGGAFVGLGQKLGRILGIRAKGFGLTVLSGLGAYRFQRLQSLEGLGGLAGFRDWRFRGFGGLGILELVTTPEPQPLSSSRSPQPHSQTLSMAQPKP